MTLLAFITAAAIGVALGLYTTRHKRRLERIRRETLEQEQLYWLQRRGSAMTMVIRASFEKDEEAREHWSRRFDEAHNRCVYEGIFSSDRPHNQHQGKTK